MTPEPPTPNDPPAPYPPAANPPPDSYPPPATYPPPAPAYPPPPPPSYAPPPSYPPHVYPPAQAYPPPVGPTAPGAPTPFTPDPAAFPPPSAYPPPTMFPPAPTTPPPPGTNGFAIASLVLGLTVIGSVLGLIFGIVGLSQTKRTGQKGGGLANAGTVISAIWLLLGVVVVAIGMLPDQSPTRDPDTGVITQGDDVDVLALQVGDCIAAFDDEQESFADLPAVPCSQPHHGEIYAVFDMPGVTYPGEDEVIDYADAECGERLQAYSQSAWDNQDIEIFYLYPNSRGWNGGDHGIACLAIDFEHTMTGSIKD